MLYDSANNSGWLVAGMKNLRQKKKINKNAFRQIVYNTPETTTLLQYSEMCAKKDVDFLKSTKVDEENMEIIKEKLKLTSSYRKKMVNDPSIDLLEFFPYFFTSPNLVSMVY